MRAMHSQDLVGLKDLMAHIFEKFGPEAVVLEVVQDPGSHPEGCGCMGDLTFSSFCGRGSTFACFADAQRCLRGRLRVAWRL